ncbi:MAG: glycosyl hydrolase 115 family protein [Clostridia bacterium]|nr:glycosyl hydrolase 115 family protein [Clostridia bacterium]
MNDYLKYWTGSKSINPPECQNSGFPIRCYFDNDSDELINFRAENGKVNLEVYRSMVKSLKTMGYNAIDIHDQLGRAEFYLWDSYKKYWDYQPDINHIDKLIDIIHEEGMLVQIPMYLGWAFHPLNEQHECWFTHKETWIDTWKYYMDSPLGKGDLFLLRPRSPIYDVKYRCQCEKCIEAGTGLIMTQVFDSIEKIIRSKKPKAKLICDLYAEGLELFKDRTFTVSSNWLLLYADNGFGKLVINESGADKSYKKGIYLHAGFWLNHTVMDPHLAPLAESIKKAAELDMTDYILVNGQSFKNFILPLEAIMRMCDEGEKYSNESFLSDWISRVLNIKNQETVIKIIDYMNNLAELHLDMAVRPAYLSPDDDVDRGFQANMIQVLYPLIYQLNKKNNPDFKLHDESFTTRKKEVAWTYNKACELHKECKELYSRVILIEDSILDITSKNAFNDQFTFPMGLLTKELEMITVLFEAIDGKKTMDETIKCLQEFYELAVKGSSLLKFTSWTHPENSRMHHPIPELSELLI